MKKIVLFFILILTSQDLISQNFRCSTMDRFKKFKSKDVNTQSRMENLNAKTVEFKKNKPNFRNALASGIINIPVVVHVLYNSELENISDQQIQSQIDVLNEDFRLQNSDSLLPSHPFWVNATDCLIEFCLASQDENGNPSNGITRTYTDSLSFSGNDFEKFNETGGKDNWDPTQYLNMWVCNLDGSGGTLGYAQFPSDLAEYPETDGVVIDFRCFGRIGTAGIAPFEDNDIGRTATHEVGHWLNLFHIWGDDQCGDDLVYDTPTQEYSNFSCPQFPSVSCNNGPNGDMFMNYMDYVNDNCMCMFSFGQSERMDAAIFNIRDGLLNSNGCNPPIQNSWNCINDACVDPMDGIGIYDSLEECEANCNIGEVTFDCISAGICMEIWDGIGEFSSIDECLTNCNPIADSWNCVNDVCVNPMDGSGEFSTLNYCEQVCQNISSINENLNDVNIYPNPSSNIFNLEFNSDSETEITVTNILGEKVYFESTKSNGEFNTQIDLSNYSKGIYNLTLKTSDGVSNHKLTLH